MRFRSTFFWIALGGLAGCGGSDAPRSDAAQTSVPAATDPAAAVARIISAEAATFGNIYPVAIKIEKGGFAASAPIEVLTKSGERVAGSVELPANTQEVKQGDEVKVTLVLKQPASFTDALLTPQGAVVSYEDAEKLLKPTEPEKPAAEHPGIASKGKDDPSDKTGKTTQFSCSLAGKPLTTTAFQGFSIGAGNEVVYLGQSNKDLLAYATTGGHGEPSFSNTPVDGGRLGLDALKPEAPITLVLTLGSEFPDDASKALRLTIAVKGITKASLSHLPLTVPIIPSTVNLTGSPTAPGAEASVQFAYDVHYVGEGGEVVIEALDPPSRSILGTVRADLKFQPVGGKGEKLFGDAVSITDGRFDIPPLPIEKAAGRKKAPAAH